MTDGLHRRWRQLMDAGITIIAVRDNPRVGVEFLECVAQYHQRLTACTFSRREAERQNASAAQLAAVERTPGVHWLDFNDFLCPAERCPPVIGNALVYRQSSHVTTTYVRTMAPRIEKALAAIIGD